MCTHECTVRVELEYGHGSVVCQSLQSCVCTCINVQVCVRAKCVHVNMCKYMTVCISECKYEHVSVHSCSVCARIDPAPAGLCSKAPFSLAASSNGPSTSFAPGSGPTALGRHPAGAPSPASVPGPNLPGGGPHSAEAPPDATATPAATRSSPSTGTSGLTIGAGPCSLPACRGTGALPGVVCVGWHCACPVRQDQSGPLVYWAALSQPAAFLPTRVGLLPRLRCFWAEWLMWGVSGETVAVTLGTSSPQCTGWRKNLIKGQGQGSSCGC